MLTTVTLEDAYAAYNLNKTRFIINDGEVVDFEFDGGEDIAEN